MDFDWYQATIAEPTDRVLTWCEGAYADCERGEGRGHNGYTNRADFTREGILQLSVSYGGSNGPPNAKATSAAAPRFAAAIREAFPRCGQIRVTRVDACQDFEGPGAFDSAQAVMKDLSLRRNIPTNYQGDWDRAENGRSYYLGSKHSPFRCLLYEKGIQMHESIVASGGPPRPNLCRLEGRYRPPHPEAKIATSTLTPQEIWGCCRWAPAVLQAVLNLDVERIHMTEYRVPDVILSRRALVRQYLRTIEGIILEADHDETAVGKIVMDLFESAVRERDSH